MGGMGSGVFASGTRARRVLDRFALGNLQRIGAIGALLATAAFGGLDTAEPVTHLTWNKPFSNGPLRITPLSLEVVCDASQVPQSAKSLVGFVKLDAVVALTATIENTEDKDIPLDRPVNEPKTMPRTNIFDLSNSVSSNYSGMFTDGGPYIPSSRIIPGKVAKYTMIWTVPKRLITNEFSVRIYELFKGVLHNETFYIWTHRDPASYGQISIQPKACAHD